MNKQIETRAEFQELAEARLQEAKALLDLGLWDGAYYLAGYSVELGLKSCIIKSLMATDSFPRREFWKNCYTHDLQILLEAAMLSAPLRIAEQGNPRLGANWSVVKQWSEQQRYARISQRLAEGLILAIADNDHGVLQWIKSQW